MKNILFSFLLLLGLCTAAQARVFWLGRNIDMALQFGIHTQKDWRMVRTHGHSLLVILPENPQKFALRYNPRNPNAYFTELEKDFGHGYKGFIIAAYAEQGTQTIGHADGYLVAHINAPREMESVRDFFSQKDGGKWNFAFGEVFSPFSDEEFALRLLQHARYYMAYTRKNPLPYGTFYSIVEPYTSSRPNKAVNCNAFAYSLVRYAGATQVPDLYQKRVMPGINNLLPAHLFLPQKALPVRLAAFEKYTPGDDLQSIPQIELRNQLLKCLKDHFKTQPAQNKFIK